jgi:ribosomal protein S18 acetylase RimI-like enzyme
MGASATGTATAGREADARTWRAHADAEEVEGRLREPAGGAADLPGIRLMASGLGSPAFNNGDVTDAGRVDLGQVREWYAERGVPWGVRVPSGMAWTAGHRLLEKRLMALPARQLRPTLPVPGLSVRRAGPDDLAAVLAVDRAAFGGPAHEDGPEDDLGRAWLQPHLGSRQVEVALAALDGVPVATAYCVRSAGRAGPAAALGGVAVLEQVRRRGIGAAVSSWLLQRAVDGGAGWAQLSPDTEQAARVYRRLGFTECRGFTVHVDL